MEEQVFYFIKQREKKNENFGCCINNCFTTDFSCTFFSMSKNTK